MDNNRKRAVRMAGALAGLILLSACASGPIKTDEPIDEFSVSQLRTALAEDDDLQGYETATVLWGGVILSTQNLESTTQVEIMAYPLDRRQRPQAGRKPEGRFLVRSSEFLEPVDYAEGRLISVLGQVSGATTGTVGQASYQYPTVQASALHLWSEQDEGNAPRLLFGIGVNIDL